MSDNSKKVSATLPSEATSEVKKPKATQNEQPPRKNEKFSTTTKSA